ncbi:hypothetical protein FO519_007983 [Halicephalobus sp. NKZ332]|nr:hypothetical protein FO519_007983 [Halicephalobus sp. NKZ332]
MATIPPPPPPPPAPIIQQPSKILAHRERTSADRNNVGGVRTPSNSQHRSPLANIHPEALQHQLANLRKTQYREPLLSSQPEQLLGRPSEFPSGGYREGCPQYEGLGPDHPGTEIPSANSGPHEHLPFDHSSQYSYSLNQAFNNPSRPLYSNPEPPYSDVKTTYSNFETTHSNSKTPYNNPYSTPKNSFIDPRASKWMPGAQAQQMTYTANYIPNPQQYIHEFATNTPAAQLEPEFQEIQYSSSNSKQKPYSFVEELRNSTLTDRQKLANQHQKSSLPERLPPQTIAHIYEQSTAETQRQLTQRRGHQENIDELVRDMEWKMNTGLGDICTKCEKEILNDTPGVTALGKAYHVTCFLCDQCQKQLAGCSFYSVDGKNLCQVDYMNSLDKCDKCATPITQKILRAMGKAFHPECFTCPVCIKSLDGTPFTVDQQGVPYCLECYHERFSPRCAVCLKAIIPAQGETEVARIVAMDRSYHVQCYKCEDCGLQLNSKIEGQGCYPLETHLFCKNCNLKRLKAMH